jgi:hypothetical protein
MAVIYYQIYIQVNKSMTIAIAFQVSDLGDLKLIMLLADRE